MFEMLTDTAFAFLPVLIAYSATKNSAVIDHGIVVGLMMVAPQLPTLGQLPAEMQSHCTYSVYRSLGIKGRFSSNIVGLLVSKLEKWFRKFVYK